MNIVSKEKIRNHLSIKAELSSHMSNADISPYLYESMSNCKM